MMMMMIIIIIINNNNNDNNNDDDNDNNNNKNKKSRPCVTNRTTAKTQCLGNRIDDEDVVNTPDDEDARIEDAMTVYQVRQE